MTFRPWFTREISIRLTDEHTGFISTIRYGKIHLKPEAVRTGKTTEGVPITEDSELRKSKNKSYEA